MGRRGPRRETWAFSVPSGEQKACLHSLPFTSFRFLYTGSMVFRVGGLAPNLLLFFYG
jgi:hypothetical protein